LADAGAAGDAPPVGDGDGSSIGTRQKLGPFNYFLQEI
jgi:hypothetical protein